MGRSLQSIINDLKVGDTISDLVDWLEKKAEASGLQSLSSPARTIYLADRYDAGMFRGGFLTLMLWDPRFDIMQMIPALEAIGATGTAQVLRDLAAIFPGGRIPLDPQERSRGFDAASAQLHQESVALHGAAAAEEEPCRLEVQLRAAGENIWDLTAKFAVAHADELLHEENNRPSA